MKKALIFVSSLGTIVVLAGVFAVGYFWAKPAHVPPPPPIAQKEKMDFVNTVGGVDKYFLTFDGNALATVYKFAPGAKTKLLFYPKGEQLAGANLVFTGTYTSPNGKVSGDAWDAKGKNVGTSDKKFFPNAYLAVDTDGFEFFPISTADSDLPENTIISVYKLINDGHIDCSSVKDTTDRSTVWRFLVSAENRWMFFTFERKLTLDQACADIVAAFPGENISACLLSTEMIAYNFYCGEATNANPGHYQSNVIVVK